MSVKASALGLYPNVDATDTWQRALDVMAKTGGKLELEAGSYRTRRGGILDLWRGRWDHDEFAVSIVGDGSGCTEIVCDGPEPGLTVIGGMEGAQVHLRNTISGIKFRGAKGLHIEKGAFFKLEDIYCMGCDDALVMIDTLSCVVDQFTTGWCKRGVFLKRGQFSHPNAIAFRSCYVSGSEYGLQMHGGSAVKWDGGSLESCGRGGVGPDRCAIKIVHAGYEGSVALNLDGTYIEGTAGHADVWIVGGVRPCVYNISGTSFGRIDPDAYAWHPIRIDCEAGRGLQTVNVGECGFWSVPGYQPSPSRKYIARTGTGPVQINHAGRGNYYQHQVEAP